HVRGRAGQARDRDHVLAARDEPRAQPRLSVLSHPGRAGSVSIPQIELGDRRFQHLVDEGRMRAGEVCPEWTEHNVSDPGITLIELFAWMTEMLGYRLNRIPDKLQLALLQLLGIQVAEPVAATTEVRFRLAAPAVDAVEIPAGTTEVGTVRTASDESIVFQTSYDF